MSNVLVFLEYADGEIKKACLPAITFGQAYAKASGGALHLGLIGADTDAAAQSAKGYGAAQVHCIKHACFEHYLAESYTTALATMAKAAEATMVAAVSSSTSKDLLPRVAIKLEAGMASDVEAIVDEKTFRRPMWAGNVVATVELTTTAKVVTVRGSEFNAPESGDASPLNNIDFSVDLSTLKTEFVSLKGVKSERPDVTTADRVVSGGRGVGSEAGFKLIEQLADKLGAGVGASRAVCDAGWVPNDYQIGQTGKVVAPDLYFAIGISGAIQHIAGMKGSKTIVAINKDPDAPIFQVADYGIVDDLFKVVPELLEKI